MNIVSDLLTTDCPLLFVDNNPIPESERGKQHHFFAGSRNQFFRLLNQSGILDKQVKTDQEAFQLYNIAFAYFVHRPTSSEKYITNRERDIGKQQLKRNIDLHNPKVVCFVDKKCCQYFLCKRSIEFGLAGDYNDIPVYCLPNPSSWGTTLSYDTKLEYWKEFAMFLNENGFSV